MIARLFGAAALAIVTVSPAAAQSCYDLWYERNLIYAQNGYCFQTDLAQRTFAGFSCWTRNPSLTSAEQRRVDQIRAMERQRGCRVNQ